MAGVARKRRVARDSVYEELRGQIVQWRLLPGERLSEEQLASDMGLSRTPIREALYRLEAERLVSRNAAGTASVAEIFLEDIEHLYAVRTALEQVALRAACTLVVDEDFELFEADLAAMRVAAEVGDPVLVAEYGAQFHGRFHRISRNAICVSLLEQLKPHTDRYRALNVEISSVRSAAALDEHRGILEALRARDQHLSGNLLAKHLNTAKEVALGALRELEDTEWLGSAAESLRGIRHASIP